MEEWSGQISAAEKYDLYQRGARENVRVIHDDDIRNGVGVDERRYLRASFYYGMQCK